MKAWWVIPAFFLICCHVCSPYFLFSASPIPSNKSPYITSRYPADGRPNIWKIEKNIVLFLLWTKINLFGWISKKRVSCSSLFGKKRVSCPSLFGESFLRWDEKGTVLEQITPNQCEIQWGTRNFYTSMYHIRTMPKAWCFMVSHSTFFYIQS